MAASTLERELGEFNETSHQYPKGWQFGIVIIALCLGTFLIAIDNTIIGVALPKITTVFNSLDDVGWYGSAYLLTVTALQPSFSNVYNFFHVKATYIVSIAIFEVGSILCAAAPNSPAFILGRAIAGVGAAGLFQGALCIVGLSVPLEDRPLYLGIVVSVFGVATCFGPILGGVFTDHVNWRWCFWINVPVGVLACILIMLFFTFKPFGNVDRLLPFKKKLSNLDVLGATNLVAAVCCLLLALQWGGTTMPWRAPTIIGLFVGFVFLSITFGFLQWRFGEKATIPLRILRQQSVLMGSWYIFFFHMSNFVIAYFIPFYFQAVKSVSATSSGIRFIALAFPQVFAIVVAGAIVSKTGYYVPFMILGVLVGAVGTGLLIRIGLDTTTIQWATYLVIAGLGTGIGMQQPFSALHVVLSERDVTVGNGITVLFSQLGGALAIPIGQTLLINGLIAEVPKFAPNISAQEVIQAGATNLGSITTQPANLRAIKEAYGKAIVRTLIFALVAISIALPFAFGMERKNIKRVSAQRTLDRQNRDDTIEITTK